MKETLVVAAAVAALAVAAAPPAGAGTRLPPAAPAGQMVFYGHIESLTRSDGRYLLRFDPAWLLEGTTAEKAAVADGVLPPGEPVPNDNYTRDESHKLLTFLVPRTARVTVLTRGIHSTPDSFGSPLGANSVQFLMVDGSVRFIRKTVSNETLKALATPDGGDEPSNDW